MSESRSGREFIDFAVARGALLFGDFTTKSGRNSPYFFNAGNFNDGGDIVELGRFYAAAAMRAGWEFDSVFGPAYKGITIACGVAAAVWADSQRRVSVSFNRKETKDHGEGGDIVGDPGKRPLIVDDVITAGISAGEAADALHAAGAKPCGMVVALDRMEVSQPGSQPAIEVAKELIGAPVAAIATVDDVCSHLHENGMQDRLDLLKAYRERYGC